MYIVIIENFILIVLIMLLRRMVNEYINETTERIMDLSKRIEHLERHRNYEHIERYVQDLNSRINLIKLSNKLKEGGE